MWLFRDKSNWQKPIYNRNEEIAASVTHGVGVVLGVIGVVVLVVLSIINGTPRHIIGFGVYGISLITLYLASTLYHGFRQSRAKRMMRTFDHSAIYVFIAGTATPFLLLGAHGTKGTVLLIVIWAMAISGIIWKVLFLGRLEILATVFYVIMGWVAVLAIDDMSKVVPISGLILVSVGGAIYMLGIIFYAWEKIPYNHVIWHLFVLAGSAFHFFAITTLVTV